MSVFDRALGGSGVGSVAIPGALIAGIRARGLGHADLCGIERAEQLAASLGRPRGGLTVSADVLQGQTIECLGIGFANKQIMARQIRAPSAGR